MAAKLRLVAILSRVNRRLATVEIAFGVVNMPSAWLIELRSD